MPKSTVPKAKLTCYVDPDVHKAIRMEAIQRSMSIGDLVEEAFRRRIQTTWNAIGSAAAPARPAGR